VDTALRKLQSLMRNNVNSNFGQRLKSAEAIADRGGVDILPSVAGQAMNSATPRGLQGTVASGAGLGTLLHPGIAASLPFFSPRAVGEAAHAAGKVTRALTPEAKLAEMLRKTVPAGARSLQRPKQDNQE